MDFNLFFFNRCFDKNRLKALLSWCLRHIGENGTLEVVEDLKELGFRYATQAGISIGLNDLQTPPNKPLLVSQAEKNMRITQQEFLGGRITATEKSQRVVDTWHRTSEILKQKVVDHFRFTDSLNPVYVMALSGARGNFSQVRQLVGMRGLMADPQGLIISFPIRSNFREGLTLTEYFISCYGARKGLVDTALRTADTGYLTRRLVDVSHHMVVRKATCKTQNGILLTGLQSRGKPILLLKERLVGRVLAAAVSLDPQSADFSECKDPQIKDFNSVKTSSGERAERDQEISVDLAKRIAALQEHVLVRSPLTCSLRFDICQLCYGWSLSQGSLVTIGEAVGIIAAQSIGEPGTQLTMRTFHTGGVFSGDLLEEIRSPYSGYIQFPEVLQGLLIRIPHGRIAFLTKTPGSMVLVVPSAHADERQVETANAPLRIASVKSPTETRDQQVPFVLESSTLLFVRQGERVLKDQLLAEFSSVDQDHNERIQSKQILFAELSGQVYVESMIQKKNTDPDTGYQQKLSQTLGFVWIFSGKEFQENRSLTLYKQNGHLVDTESLHLRIDRSNSQRRKNRFVAGDRSHLLTGAMQSESEISAPPSHRVATLLTHSHTNRIPCLVAKVNYNDNHGYAFSSPTCRQGLYKSLINRNDIAQSVVQANTPKRKGMRIASSLYLIERRIAQEEQKRCGVDKFFFPKKMFSLLKGQQSDPKETQESPKEGEEAEFNQSWAAKASLFASGKILHELPRKRDNLYTQHPQDLFAQSLAKSKNKINDHSSSKGSNSFLINKQNRSRFLFLWFLGKSFLLHGGTIWFDRLYSERDRNRGQFFWLPQENYQVMNLLLPFCAGAKTGVFADETDGDATDRHATNSRDISQDLNEYTNGNPTPQTFVCNKDIEETHHKQQTLHPNSRLKALKRSMFKTSPITREGFRDVLQHSDMLKDIRPAGRASGQGSQVENLSRRRELGAQKSNLVGDRGLVQRRRSLKSHTQRAGDTKQLLSSSSFWAEKRTPVGFVLNLQGDHVPILLRSNGWLTRLFIGAANESTRRDQPRFTRNCQKVFWDEGLPEESLSREREGNRWLSCQRGAYVASNPCTQRHQTLLKASFHTADAQSLDTSLLKEPKGARQPWVHMHLQESYHSTPVLSQRLALLNLLPSGALAATHTNILPLVSRRNNPLAQPGQDHNLCLNVKPGWFYIPKDLCVFAKALTASARTSSSKTIHPLIDDIAFEQTETALELLQLRDFPFHVAPKQTSLLLRESDIQPPSVGFGLKPRGGVVLAPFKSQAERLLRQQVRIPLPHLWEELWKESSAVLGREKDSEERCLLRKKRALALGLRRDIKQGGSIGQLVNKRHRLHQYLFSEDILENQPQCLLDQSALLLLRQLLWTDCQPFSLEGDWDQQIDGLGWLRGYRISTQTITNLSGRHSLSCLPVSQHYRPIGLRPPLSLQGSGECGSNSIFRLLPPQDNRICSFEVISTCQALLAKQGIQIEIEDFKDPVVPTLRMNKKRRAVLFQKIIEKNFIDVLDCKRLLYGKERDLIPGGRGPSQNYMNKQENESLYRIVQEARINLSHSLPLSKRRDGVFSFAPLHFARFAVNRTSSFVQSSPAFPRADVSEDAVFISKDSQIKDLGVLRMQRSTCKQSNRGDIRRISNVDALVASKGRGAYLKRLSKTARNFGHTFISRNTPTLDVRMSSPTADPQSLHVRTLSPNCIEDANVQCTASEYSDSIWLYGQQEGVSETTKECSSLRGEVVQDPLGDMVLLNSDQMSFSTGAQTIQVVPGQLVRSGEEITIGDPISKFSKGLQVFANEPIEENALSNTGLAIDMSGQVLKVERGKITLRKAQAVLFYSQAVSHVSHGQWVRSGSPVLTLTHQTLVTGDIVQGIPKIEQFFEASTTKQGTENLHGQLQTLFKNHKRSLPRPQAVRRSLEDIQQVLVEGIQRVYLSQGVLIADKHLEVVVKQMTFKGRIIESGDTGLFHGELIAIRRIEGINLITPGKKAVYVPAVVGLTRISLDSDSFISAASFQETTRVLTRDAISGRTDFLRGLKEKVVLGDLISAGTGLDNYLMYNLVMLRTPKPNQANNRTQNTS